METYIQDEFGNSWISEVNFYRGSKKIGISDNHRMAFYHFGKYGENNSHFVHIDTHPDFSRFSKNSREAILANPGYLDTPESFIKLQRLGEEKVAVNWGDWIEGLRGLFPQLIKSAQICVQKNTASFEQAWPEAEIISAPATFPIIPPSSDLPTLYSLDIDYYFTSGGNFCELRIEEPRALEHFRKTLHLIKEAPDCLPFIALSPTCCGGWENTLPFTRIVDEIYGTNVTRIIEEHL